MSSSTETLQLQLGDIVQIESPTNDKLNEQIFLIIYIDNEQIEIKNITTLAKTTLILDEQGELEDETIDSISLLSRDKEEGYARQHGLLPKTWITITFGGDLPAIFNGEITNLEEDMIEINTFPEKEVIYIDFAYKGIPKDLPIKSIEIRDPPELDLVTTETPPSEDVEKQRAPLPEIKQQIQQFIIQADEITLGKELGQITQEVPVDDSYERYGIQTQTNDLLDELLATIPGQNRSTKLLNKIHLMIERYKELRNIFSNKDTYGNPISPIKKSADYKPLVKSLQNLNKKLAWILPVVKNKKKLYDVDPSSSEYADDIVNMTMAEGQIQETDALEQYTNNNIPDSENKYDYLLKVIQENANPYENPDEDPEQFLTRQHVETNLATIVDNLDDFYSSVVDARKMIDSMTGSSFDIRKKRFLIAKYNLGLSKLKTVVEQGSKPYNKRVQATESNKAFIKSFVLLPEDAIRYSRVQLPGSSILLKSALNKEGFKYYKRFTKDTNIDTQVIESFETPIQHTFLQNTTEIVLDDSLQNDENKYEKYLNSIVPKTRSLFNLVKKYIDEKLTLSEVVKELEPFLVYSDDLTYRQYRDIITFIKSKINEYKKTFVTKNREFRGLVSGKKFADKTWYSLFNILTKDRRDVLDDHYGVKMRGYNSSENYRRIMELDCGRLFLTAVALENLLLMTPVDINDIFERERLQIKDEQKEEKNSSCATFKLVKKYIELDELLDDNDKEIYVDKNLDHTHYDILDEYKDEQDKLSSSQFLDFLKEKLVENIGLSIEDAEKDAIAMVDGKRKVEEGEFASLEIDEGEKTYYYKRVSNKWERDESVPDVKMDDTMLCNIQKECVQEKNDCETTDQAEKSAESSSLTSLIDEFNNNYEVSKEEMTRMIENRFAYFKYRLSVIKKLNVEERYKYNDLHIKLGENLEERDEIKVSPYAKLRDIILGQADLVKRNNDIIRFKNMFLRDASEDQDQFWCYCIETNTKLLPVFLVRLASTFLENQYDYVKVLDQICATQGKLSDDGNAWVDEHSGYVIKSVEFSTEEGYDEAGFKAQTRDVILEDLRAVRGAELESKFSDPNAEKISNVIRSMAGYMGFHVEPMQEFIIRNTLLVTGRIVPGEEEYNKKRDAAAKKGKKIAEYKDAFNTSLLLVTFIYLVVAIQTAIPSIKTKKQFPGCKKSFEGFPLAGNGDDSGIAYIACVANKIKSGVAPWNVLKKMNSTGIAKRMKDLINKFVIPDSNIQTLFNQKRAYLLEGTDEDIPVELDISNWQTFLPPLRPITTIPREEISKEFKDELIRNIRAGKAAQEKQIQAMISNMIHYPMVMVEEIQKVVKKEVPVLTNLAEEAFLENACCLSNEYIRTIDYFKERIPALEKYNEFVKNLHSIYSDIKAITLAPRIFSPVNTRRVYPPLSNAFSKKTIYRAIIEHCRFGTLFPVPENLQNICLTKPEGFSLLDSLSKQIKLLEDDGKNFTQEDMERLLFIVSRENILHFDLYDVEKSALEKFRDYLDEDAQVIPDKLHTILKNLVDTFELNVEGTTPEMKQLINFLDKEINSIKTNLVVFLQNNSKLSKRKFNQIMEVIQKTEWVSTDGKTLTGQLRSIDFMKNWIYELTQVFPNMIVNEVDFDSVTFPTPWRKGMSDRHQADVRNIIYNYYRTFSKFYGNSVLKPLMEKITSRTQIWRDFVNVLPIFEQVEKDKYVPTLNTGLIEQLATYGFLMCLTEFTSIVDETTELGMPIQSSVPVRDDEFVATTTEEVVNEAIGNISEIDIISGEKLQRSEEMTEFLLEILQHFQNTKKLLNYSYQDIIYRVNISKEKEKDQFTKRLKDLSDEEREIESLMKNHKLGVWSKGLSKGVTQYEKDTYDEEREAMERIIEIERQVGKQDFVSDMNRDIYMNEAQEEARRGQEIEAEEMRIQYMGEDADYDEMGMDGDEMY